MQIGNFTGTDTSIHTDLIYDYSVNKDGSQWPNIHKAQCATGCICKSCLNEHLPHEVYFTDGDLFVVGILPVYDGDKDNPMQCGGIRTAISMQIGMAMMNVVDKVNDENFNLPNSYFPNKKIGLVLINSCNQQLLCESKLMSLLQGNLKLRNGSIVDISKKILGFVGSLTSSVTMASANVLTKFGFVQVSYASTAASLSDRVRFPYVLRTPTPDDKQAITMLNIIEDFGSNYIQVIYSKGDYGEGAFAILTTEAAKRKICIANDIEVTEGQYATVRDTLRKYPFAKIVIIFVQSHMVDELLNVVYENMDDKEFVFLASESLGKREEILRTRTKFEGTISLALEMNDSLAFRSSLLQGAVAMQKGNPWINAYLEQKYKCYFPGSFDKISGTPCALYDTLIERSINYTDLWTPFASNAMMALLKGTSSVFSDLCGANSRTLCDDYRNNPTTVYDVVKAQKLMITGNNELINVFDSNGDGNIGYVIYQAQRNPSDPQTLHWIKVCYSIFN